MVGYCIFFVGKWYLGSKGFWLEDYGFDINKGGWEKGLFIGGYFLFWINFNFDN